MPADPGRAAAALGEVGADIEVSTGEVTGQMGHADAMADPQATLETMVTLLADMATAWDALRARRRSCPGPTSEIWQDAHAAGDVVAVRRSSGLQLGQRLAVCTERLEAGRLGAGRLEAGRLGAGRLGEVEATAGRSEPGPAAEAVSVLVRRATRHLAASRSPQAGVSGPTAIRSTMAAATEALREADAWRGAAAAQGRAGHLRPRLDDAGSDGSARIRTVRVAVDRVAASGRSTCAALTEAARTLAAADCSGPTSVS